MSRKGSNDSNENTYYEWDNSDPTVQRANRRSILEHPTFLQLSTIVPRSDSSFFADAPREAYRPESKQPSAQRHVPDYQATTKKVDIDMTSYYYYENTPKKRDLNTLNSTAYQPQEKPEPNNQDKYAYRPTLKQKNPDTQQYSDYHPVSNQNNPNTPQYSKYRPAYDIPYKKTPQPSQPDPNTQQVSPPSPPRRCPLLNQCPARYLDKPETKARKVSYSRNESMHSEQEMRDDQNYQLNSPKEVESDIYYHLSYDLIPPDGDPSTITLPSDEDLRSISSETLKRCVDDILPTKDASPNPSVASYEKQEKTEASELCTQPVGNSPPVSSVQNHGVNLPQFCCHQIQQPFCGDRPQSNDCCNKVLYLVCKDGSQPPICFNMVQQPDGSHVVQTQVTDGSNQPSVCHGRVHSKTCDERNQRVHHETVSKCHCPDKIEPHTCQSERQSQYEEESLKPQITRKNSDSQIYNEEQPEIPSKIVSSTCSDCNETMVYHDKQKSQRYLDRNQSTIDDNRKTSKYLTRKDATSKCDKYNQPSQSRTACDLSRLTTHENSKSLSPLDETGSVPISQDAPKLNVSTQTCQRNSSDYKRVQKRSCSVQTSTIPNNSPKNKPSSPSHTHKDESGSPGYSSCKESHQQRSCAVQTSNTSKKSARSARKKPMASNVERKPESEPSAQPSSEEQLQKKSNLIKTSGMTDKKVHPGKTKKTPAAALEPQLELEATKSPQRRQEHQEHMGRHPPCEEQQQEHLPSCSCDAQKLFLKSLVSCCLKESVNKASILDGNKLLVCRRFYQIQATDHPDGSLVKTLRLKETSGPEESPGCDPEESTEFYRLHKKDPCTGQLQLCAICRLVFPKVENVLEKCTKKSLLLDFFARQNPPRIQLPYFVIYPMSNEKIFPEEFLASWNLRDPC